MKKVLSLILAIAILMSILTAIPVSANNDDLKTEKENTLIVTYKQDIKDSIEISKEIKSKIIKTKKINSKVEYIVANKKEDIDSIINEYKKDANVASVEKNEIYECFSVSPNDPYYTNQWGLKDTTAGIYAQSAWDYEQYAQNQESVVVAVIDTGITPTHEDLQGRIASGGYNFYQENTNFIDDFGHGTLVSGVIAANTNNNIGIAGASGEFDIKILPIKANVTNQGSFYFSDLIQSIYYAINQNVDIINMSLGGSMQSSAFSQAIQSAYLKNITVIAAAGNSGSSVLSYPASYNNVISVGATQSDGQIAYYSTYNSMVDISAPGSAIYSTTKDGSYNQYNGTSFAAPMVAGVAAMIKSMDPNYTPSQITDLLINTAVDKGGAGRDDYFGYGLVNASNAMATLVNTQDIANTIASISAIGTPVTLNSLDDIEYAESLYNGLTAVEKEHVTNYDDLVNARATYDALEYDALVDALPSIQNLTLQDKGNILDADAAYYELTELAQGLVLQVSRDKIAALLHRISELEGFSVSGYVSVSGATVTIDNKSDITDENGYFKIDYIASNTYNMVITKTGAITRTISINVDNNHLLVSAITKKIDLLFGDGNGDYSINILDLGSVKSKLGQTDAQWDFNFDGIINNYDINIVKNNYISTYTTWTIPTSAVQSVIDAIDAIDTVAITSGTAISTAETAYSALSASEKSQVTNYSTLTAARITYDALAIPEVGITYSDETPEVGDIITATVYVKNLPTISDINLVLGYDTSKLTLWDEILDQAATTAGNAINSSSFIALKARGWDENIEDYNDFMPAFTGYTSSFSSTNGIVSFGYETKLINSDYDSIPYVVPNPENNLTVVTLRFRVFSTDSTLIRVASASDPFNGNFSTLYPYGFNISVDLAFSDIPTLVRFPTLNDVELQTVINEINNIGTPVTLDSLEDIEYAEELYRVLNNYQKPFVSNYSTLISARESYNDLILVEVTFDNATGSITGYIGSGGDLVIPKVINGINVIAIDSGVFSVCTTITSITLPDSITSIPDGEFAYMSSLISINIPSSVTSLGDDLFAGCNNLTQINVDVNNQSYSNNNGDGVLYNKSMTTLIQYPKGKSGSYTIPYGVTDIKEYAFLDSILLTDIDLPNSLTMLDDFQFLNCSSLVSIDIPESITNIGNYVFEECKKLTQINVDENNLNYSNNNGDGVLFNKSMTVLIKYPQAKDGAYAIPYGVTNIKDNAFYDCDNLIDIIIPNSVESIGEFNFFDCAKLINAVVPSSVTSIGNLSFNGTIASPFIITLYGEENSFVSQYASANFIPFISYIIDNDNAIITGCEYYVEDTLSIPSVIEGYPVTEIEQGVFYNFNSLLYVIIPNTITEIGDNAFDLISEYSYIIGQSNSVADAYATDNYLGFISYSVNSSEVSITGYEGYIFEVTIPYAIDGKKVTSIADYAFSGSALYSISLSGSITDIGNYAFSNCTSLVSVSLPSKLTAIKEGVFMGCNSLMYFSLPSSITSIGAYAFSGCSSISNLIMWNSITSIGTDAFSGCSSLYMFGNEGSDAHNYAISNSLPYITYVNETSSISITGYSGPVQNVSIPHSIKGVGITKIKEGAFDGCTTLQTIYLTNYITTIEDYAFANCSSLTDVTIYVTSVSISSNAFYNRRADLTLHGYDPSDVKTYAIANGINFEKL